MISFFATIFRFSAASALLNYGHIDWHGNYRYLKEVLRSKFPVSIILTLLLIVPSAHSQTRVFLGGGIQNVAGVRRASLQPNVEISIERRIAGSLYFTAGIAYSSQSDKEQYTIDYEQWIRDGYFYEEEQIDLMSQLLVDFGGVRIENRSSTFKSKSLQIPIGIRFNFRNQNRLLADFRILPTWLMNARLTESYSAHYLPESYWFSIHGTEQRQAEDDGTVTAFARRTSIGAGLQLSYGIGRFLLSATYSGVIIARGTRSSTFLPDWELRSNESIFFENIDGYFFSNAGVMVFYRLR